MTLALLTLLAQIRGFPPLYATPYFFPFDCNINIPFAPDFTFLFMAYSFRAKIFAIVVNEGAETVGWEYFYLV